MTISDLTDLSSPEPVVKWSEAWWENAKPEVKLTAIRDALDGGGVVAKTAVEVNNSLAQFSASPDLQTEFVGAVIGAMESHTDLSTLILNNPEISEKLMGELVPIL